MYKYRFSFLIICFVSKLSFSQSSCNDFVEKTCESFDPENNYYFEYEVLDCSKFIFNVNVQNEINEGLTNKIFSIVESSSTLKINNFNGESTSSFSETTSSSSLGLIFDSNYIKCRKNNKNLILAYINKSLFNAVTIKDFKTKIIELNKQLNLLKDLFQINNELTFEKDIFEFDLKISLMKQNIPLLQYLNIENDILTAFNMLFSKYNKFKSNLNTFENLKSKLLNFILNGNNERAKKIYRVLLIKYGNDDKYSDSLKEIKRNLKK